MNLATNHFSILNLTTSHRGLNTPNKHLLKLWQVLVGENPSIKATEHHNVMVAHDEISSTSIFWACGVVEPPKGPASCRNPSRWYQMISSPSDTIIFSQKLEPCASTTLTGWEAIKGPQEALRPPHWCRYPPKTTHLRPISWWRLN